MANLRPSIVYILIILALIAVLTALGQATPTSIMIKSGEEVVHSLNLVAEDHVLIQFTVVGGTAKSLHFSIVFPNATVRDFGNVGNFDYNFICDSAGLYKLHFANTNEAESILVTLNYEVQHYILGMPQMLFMAIIVILACVGGVAAFVYMGKSYQ